MKFLIKIILKNSQNGANAHILLEHVALDQWSLLFLNLVFCNEKLSKFGILLADFSASGSGFPDFLDLLLDKMSNFIKFIESR